MKKSLLLISSALISLSAIAAPVKPESGKYYQVKHSTGLLLTRDRSGFKIDNAAETTSPQQVFYFTAVDESENTFNIQTDAYNFMASDNGWSATVLMNKFATYAQFDVVEQDGKEYLLFQNLGQRNKKGASKSFFAPDNLTAGSAVYTDKAQSFADEKGQWTFEEVTDYQYPEQELGEDVYPDNNLPDDDPRKNVYPGYKLVFAEEFNATDGSIPTMGIWSYESGWKRNNEVQYYRAKPENIWQENGVCVINGRLEPENTVKNPSYNKNGSGNELKQYLDWTSASIKSNTTNNKYNWQFGIFEVRAKIPAYDGMWPAIWSTGVGEWPKYGEIDLLEWYGGVIHGNVCYGDTKWISNTVSYAELNKEDPNTEWGDEYHVWRMFWDYDHMEMWCDNVLVNNIDLDQTYNPVSEGKAWSGKNPFRDVRHMIWLNLALGSSGGSLDNAPQNNYYLIDYARVYQQIGTDGKALYHVDDYMPDATIKVPDKDAELTNGIYQVSADLEPEAPAEYFNLQGIRVDNPAPGQLVICRQGNKATKKVW